MPVYDVELSDGRTVTLEGDREPTESDVMAALGGSQPTPAPKPPPTPPLNVAQYVSGGGPMAGMAMLPPAPDIPRVEGGEGTLSQIGAAGLNTASSLYNAAKSPLGASLAAAAPISPLIGAAAGIGFGIPSIYRGLKKVYEYGSGVGGLQSGLEGAGEAGLGSLMTAGGAAGLRETLPKPTIPEIPTEIPTPPTTGPLLLERGAIPMADKPAPRTIPQVEQQLRESKLADEDARIAQLQGQKRASQAQPTIIGGEEPSSAQVIPAPSQSIINLARRGVYKFQFDQLQRDFEAAQAAGDGPEMGRLQKQMIDLQRQLHPLEQEREQLSGQFEGEGTWPPTSEQLGTFQSKGRTIPSKETAGPGEEALPSAEQSPSTELSRDVQPGRITYGGVPFPEPSEIPTGPQRAITPPAEPLAASESEFLSPRGELAKAQRREASRIAQARIEGVRALKQAASQSSKPGIGKPAEIAPPKVDLRQLEAQMKRGQIKPGIISGTAAERWADDLLRGGGTHAGPDVLAAYAVKGAAVIERGVRKFADWSAEMVKQFGEDVKPHLRNLYNQSLSIWQQSLDQPRERTAPSGESGVPKPGEAPVSGAVKSPVTAGEVPQAVSQTTTPQTVNQQSATPRVRQASNVLTKARDTLKSLWSTRDIRDVMTYTRDAGDNAARLFGEAQGNDIDGALKRVGGNADALSFVVESGGDRSQLGVMRQKIVDSDYAGTKWGKATIAAIDTAQKTWDKLAPIANDYVAKTDAQIDAENASGINTPKRANYVMHAQEVPNEWGFLANSDGAGGGAGFKHIRTHPTFADSIAAGVDPKSLNAVDLLKSRLSRGQTLINNRQWVESLRTTVDPKTGSPIVTDPEVIQRGNGLPADHRAPNGYHNEFAGGRPIAVLDGYGGIFDALTAPSKLAQYAGTRVLLKSAVLGKSVALMVDTFHLARVAFWESVIKPLSLTDPKVPLPSYKKGVLLLDYTPSEIMKMAKNGDLPEGTAQDVLNGKKVVDGLVSHGYNVGRISDAIHQEWMQSVPILGKVNQFIFRSFQRGAMAEIGVLEYGRYRRMNPSWTDSQVYREVAKDLNTRFGNPGRQGWIKSKTNQDLARLIVLAPQWNEGLIKSEAGAISGLVKGTARSVKEGRLSFGVLPRAVGAMMVGQFAANQLINLATRGRPTWENPEEGFGSKVSAWIPDVVGKGPGFFLHPFGLAAEVSHLFEMKMEKNPNFRNALLSFAGSRLSTLARPISTYWTGRSAIGGKSIRPEDINKETLKTVVPLPIGGSAIGQAIQQLASGENKESFPGQYQKQVMSSFGVKTDQAPSFDQRISALAGEFRRNAGLKPSGEFYAGDYDDLSSALKRGAMKEAAKAYSDLQKKKTDSQIIKHFSAHQNYPFTRSRALENQFYDSLNEEQKQAYAKALEERAKVTDSFFKMLGAQ